MKPRHRPSLSLVLALGFGALIAVAMGTLLVISLSAAQDNTHRLLRRTAELVLDSMIARVAEHLQTAESQALYLAKRLGQDTSTSLLNESARGMMAGSLAAAPQISGVGLLLAEGSGWGVGRGPEGLYELEVKWQGQPELESLMADLAASGKGGWYEVAWSPRIDHPHLRFVASVEDKTGFRGAVISVVSLQELSHYIGELQQGRGAQAFILRGRDGVVAHSNLASGDFTQQDHYRLPGLDAVGDPVMPHVWEVNDDRVSAIFDDADLQGHLASGPDQIHLVLYRQGKGYGEQDWTYGIHFPAELLSPALSKLRNAFFIGLGLLAVTLIVAYLLGRVIARPVLRVANAATKIRDFDLRAAEPLGHSPFRETEEASRAFDSMVSGLRWFETYVPRRLVGRLMELGDQAVAS